ncbi:MAG: (d)CMP kinase, partial [Bartonella sp.]|nr:(d)CMP kinase [Bartonella sp.]
MKPFIIAIDGPAASGKGTLANQIAAYYHLHHLDTGLTYRSVGYSLLKRNLPLDDHINSVAYAKELDFNTLDPILLNSLDISEAASKV